MATTPLLMQALKPKYTMCNNDADCKRHKFERCRKFRIGHPGKCMCIAGHSWTKDRKSCIGKIFSFPREVIGQLRINIYDEKDTEMRTWYSGYAT